MDLWASYVWQPLYAKRLLHGGGLVGTRELTLFCMYEVVQALPCAAINCVTLVFIILVLWFIKASVP